MFDGFLVNTRWNRNYFRFLSLWRKVHNPVP